MKKTEDYAAFWDSLNDSQKVAELTQPTRSVDTETTLADAIGEAVVSLRRKALDYPLKTQRAALVERWLVRFRARAPHYHLPSELIKTIENVIRSETTGWRGFGTKIYR